MKIDCRLKEQLNMAREGLENGRYPYGVAICKKQLERNPENVEVQRVLYRGFRGIYEEKGACGKVLSWVKFVSRLLTGGFDSLRKVEKLIEHRPNSRVGYVFLAKLAMDKELSDLLVLAYEELVRMEPGNALFEIGLAEAYLGVGASDEALEVAEGLLEREPSNTEAMELVRRAALAGMKKSA